MEDVVGVTLVILAFVPVIMWIIGACSGDL